MFDHVTIRVTDRTASERFYETVLARLDVQETARGEHFTEWDEDFSLAEADGEHPPTRGLHIGFAAPSREAVDAFWQAGVQAGYRDDGAPGPRPLYSPSYYGGFLLDPDGNSAEAVHRDDMRTDGIVDHLWVRVADVGAAKRFYETIAPHAGLRLSADTPERVSFRGSSGALALVAGRASENVHIAFPATSDEAVAAFHHAATSCGYRDNGAPGERPEYHRGYFGAFVLDPDGNNVEVVNHNRPQDD